MDPPFLERRINLRPDVVKGRVDVTGVVAQAATEECEAVGVFSATTLKWRNKKKVI